MNKIIKFINLFFSVGLFLLLGNQSFAGNIPIFIEHDLQKLKIHGKRENTSNIIPIKVNFNAIDSGGTNSANNAKVILNDEEAVIIMQKNTKWRSKDDYTWTGTVEGFDNSSVLLTVNGASMFGNIVVDGTTYSINTTDGQHYLSIDDEALLAPLADDIITKSIRSDSRKNNQKKMEMNTGSLIGNGQNIDLLMLYTKEMEDYYGTNLNTKLQHLVDYANQVLENSKIDTKLQIVGRVAFYDSTVAEDISVVTALKNLQANENASSIRQDFKADLVTLVRRYQNNSTCGAAYIFEPDDNVDTFRPYAFSVVQVKSASEGFKYCHVSTLIHELGHNMGCAHDRQSSGVSTGAFSYSYGYYSEDGNFGTIMSYLGQKISHFSRPTIKYNGYPTGVGITSLDSANCAKTIDQIKIITANYMLSEPDQNYAAVPVFNIYGIIVLTIFVSSIFTFYLKKSIAET